MIKCYVKAKSAAEAAGAAWDVDCTADNADEAPKYPDRYSPDEMRTYEVTITARVMPKRKPARKVRR